MQGVNDKERVRAEFAKRLREALNDLGIAHTEQRRLERLFGVSGQAARKWVEGLSMPTPARLPQVAEALGVRRAWLQDGDGPMRPTSAVSDECGEWEHSVRLAADEMRLISRYRLLDERQKAALEVILSDLAGDPKRRS